MWRGGATCLVCTELPGIYIDLNTLLSRLSLEQLLSSVKLALASPGVSDLKLRDDLVLRCGGLSVHVAELLHGLDRSQVLASVRSIVELLPEVKKQQAQDVLRVLGTGEQSLEASASLPALHTTPASPSSPPACGTQGRRRLSDSGSLPDLRLTSSAFASGGGMAMDNATTLAERLRIAVREKNIFVVQQLLASGADPDKCSSEDGSKPLTLAMQQGTPPVILEALLRAKASPQGRDFGQGRSLLHIWAWNLPKSKASARESQQKLQLLVSYGAELNSKMPATGDTPLHILARFFASLNRRVSEEHGIEHPKELGSPQEIQKFSLATKMRIQMLVSAKGDLQACNASGKRPLDLVDKHLWQTLVEQSSRLPIDGVVGRMDKSGALCKIDNHRRPSNRPQREVLETIDEDDLE